MTASVECLLLFCLQMLKAKGWAFECDITEVSSPPLKTGVKAQRKPQYIREVV